MDLVRGCRARIRSRHRGEVRSTTGMVMTAVDDRLVVLLVRRMDGGHAWWRCRTEENVDIDVAEDALVRVEAAPVASSKGDQGQSSVAPNLPAADPARDEESSESAFKAAADILRGISNERGTDAASRHPQRGRLPPDVPGAARPAWSLAHPKTNPDPFGAAVSARPGAAVRPPVGAQPAGPSGRPVLRGRTIPGPFVAPDGSAPPLAVTNAPPPSQPARATTDHDAQNTAHRPEPSAGRYGRSVDRASDHPEGEGPPPSNAPPSRTGSGGKGSSGRDPRSR